MPNGVAGRLLALASALLAGAVAQGALGAAEQTGLEVRVPVAPGLLSQTGLYVPGGTEDIDSRNQPYSPQYPLWSDGARKRRWVRLPERTVIDARSPDHWEFPVGTRFWKEFEFGGRKIETRFLWKATLDRWVFASYAWNDAQTDAALAPEGGIANIVEVAPGRSHSIPGVADCRACHDSARTEILGFDALQLSTDRDPNALHAEPLTHDMVTLETLVIDERISPSRRDWLAHPPRIPAADADTRAALGYLSTNCGSCHNRASSIASLGLILKHSPRANAECTAALATTVDRAGHWVVPTAPDGESRLVSPGHPELSALLARARSRRLSSQMPPIGTVVADREAIDLLTRWIQSNPAQWEERAGRCRTGS